MVELADTLDLGSSGAIHAGSSPVTRTTSSQALYRLRRFFFEKRRALTPLLLLSAKGHARFACSLASALATALFRYQPFAVCVTGDK